MDVQQSSDRLERAARNQALFRQVNEQLQDLATSFRDIANESPFTCECANTECIEPVWLSVDEYEAVRAVPNHFVVLPGHVFPDVETVKRETDRYVVVAKIGEAAEIAADHDPRA